VRGREHADARHPALVLEGLDAELGDLGLHLMEVRFAEQAHAEKTHELIEGGFHGLCVAEQLGRASSKNLHVTTVCHFRDLRAT
jgi:hypothetical protein